MFMENVSNVRETGRVTSHSAHAAAANRPARPSRRSVDRALIVIGVALTLIGLVGAVITFERAQQALSVLDIRRELLEEQGVYVNDYVTPAIFAVVAILGLVAIIIGAIRSRSRS
jgi:hypothetical protein